MTRKWNIVNDQSNANYDVGNENIYNAKGLDFAMLMYNLIEYSSNYSKTTGSLWFYWKDEATDFINNIANTNDSKSFKYKATLLGNTEAHPNPNYANEILKNTTIAVISKYLSNFWRSLEMPLINCKVELKLKWTKYCVYNPNDFVFTIKETKLYVPVVTLSGTDNQKLSKLLSKGFEKSGMNIKQKVILKIQQMNMDIYSNKILLALMDYLF